MDAQNLTHVWLVQHTFDDTPTLMSVHSSQELAIAARDVYLHDKQFGGGTADDYWVQGIRVDAIWGRP